MSHHSFRSQPMLDHGERRGLVLPIAVILGSAAVFSGSLYYLLGPPDRGQPEEIYGAAPRIAQVAEQASPVLAPALIIPAVAPAVAAPRPAKVEAAAPSALDETSDAVGREAVSIKPRDEEGRTFEERERAEGLSWAKRNAITERSACVDMGARSEAFMAGCLEYQAQGRQPDVFGDDAAAG